MSPGRNSIPSTSWVQSLPVFSDPSIHLQIISYHLQSLASVFILLSFNKQSLFLRFFSLSNGFDLMSYKLKVCFRQCGSWRRESAFSPGLCTECLSVTEGYDLLISAFFSAEDLMRKLNLLIPIAGYVTRLGHLWVRCGWRTGARPFLLQIAESRKVFQTLAGQQVSLCWRGLLHLVRARHKHCSGKSVPRLRGKECVSVSEQKPAQFRSRKDVC